MLEDSASFSEATRPLEALALRAASEAEDAIACAIGSFVLCLLVAAAPLPLFGDAIAYSDEPTVPKVPIVELGGAPKVTHMASARSERRPLEPPPEVELVPADYLSEEFESELTLLGSLVDRLQSAEMASDVEMLRSTLVSSELLGFLDVMEAHSKRLSGSGATDQAEPLRRLAEALGRLRELVADERQAKGVPISLSVDHVRRTYGVHWLETNETGARVAKTKDVPFRPRLMATVATSYDSATQAYGYRVSNSVASEVAAGRLWLEAVGLSPMMLEILEREGDIRATLPDERMTINIFMPRPGYLQDFRIHVYNLDGSGRWTEPGAAVEIPPLLRVPWPQLPGVVRCWLDIPPTEYDDGLSAESDPRIANEIFSPLKRVEDSGTGDRKAPRLMQEGRALGPVPLSTIGRTPADVLDALLTDLREAREWGWFPETPDTLRVEEQLQRLANERFPAASMTDLSSRIDGLGRSGEVSDEALILMREHVRYIQAIR